MSSAQFSSETPELFKNLALKRRSIRRYESRAISRDILDDILDTANRAPSNFNRQPWYFVVLDQPDWVIAFNQLLAESVDQVEMNDKPGDLYNVLDHVRRWLYPLQGSAALILAFYKPSPEKIDENVSNILQSGSVESYNPNLVSLGMAIQNLLLAAESHGLGGCMHSGPLPFVRGYMNELLGLPKRMELAGLISLGWPDNQPQAPKHRDLARVSRYCEGEVPEAWTTVWQRED